VTCNAGFGNCDGQGADGCEDNLNTDKNNCGGCGVACQAINTSSTSCSGGACVPVCAAGFGNCDGNGINGCEDNTNTDSNNCGTCGHKCNLANASSTCSAGGCVITSCNAGFADCNNNPADGCEVNTNTNDANCGGCFNSCQKANVATSSCSAGICTINSCNGGWGNCDNNAGNGCEDNLTNDINNCGVCNNKCVQESETTGVTCAGSACKVTTCAANWFDVDGADSNGCECEQDQVGNSCASAVSLGTIAVNAAPLNYTAYSGVSLNLTGTGNTDEDWFSVTFAQNNTCNWHPSITLVAGSEPILMAVYTGCSGSSPTGSIACGDNTNSNVGSQHWEATISGTCGASQAVDPTGPKDTGVFDNITETLYIRVYRSGTDSSCMPYSLTITN
jgi:hypothetical protein